MHTHTHPHNYTTHTHTHAYTHTHPHNHPITHHNHTHTHTPDYKSWVQLSPSSNQDGFTCFVGCTQPYLTNSEGNYWNKTSNIQSLLPQNNNHCIYGTCQFHSMTSFVLPTFYAFVNNCYQSCCD